jgi:hypothetical protein
MLTADRAVNFGDELIKRCYMLAFSGPEMHQTSHNVARPDDINSFQGLNK